MSRASESAYCRKSGGWRATDRSQDDCPPVSPPGFAERKIAETGHRTQTTTASGVGAGAREQINRNSQRDRTDKTVVDHNGIVDSGVGIPSVSGELHGGKTKTTTTIVTSEQGKYSGSHTLAKDGVSAENGNLTASAHDNVTKKVEIEGATIVEIDPATNEPISDETLKKYETESIYDLVYNEQGSYEGAPGAWVVVGGGAKFTTTNTTKVDIDLKGEQDVPDETHILDERFEKDNTETTVLEYSTKNGLATSSTTTSQTVDETERQHRVDTDKAARDGVGGIPGIGGNPVNDTTWETTLKDRGGSAGGAQGVVDEFNSWGEYWELDAQLNWHQVGLGDDPDPSFSGSSGPQAGASDGSPDTRGDVTGVVVGDKSPKAPELGPVNDYAFNPILAQYLSEDATTPKPKAKLRAGGARRNSDAEGIAKGFMDSWPGVSTIVSWWELWNQENIVDGAPITPGENFDNFIEGAAPIAGGLGGALGGLDELGDANKARKANKSKNIAAAAPRKLSKAPIRNAHLAGRKHPKTGIPFDAEGFPDFSSVATHSVEIKQVGNYTTDYTTATRAAGIDKIPDNYTWHHHQNGTTMQLV